MHSFPIRNIMVYLPSCWEDIDRRSLLWLAQRFPYGPTHGLAIDFFWHSLQLWNKPRLQLAIAKNFINSRRLTNASWRNDEVMEFGEVNFFEQQIVQAISDMNNFAWLNESITIPELLIKSIRIGFTNYYGPQERLSNMTADEFKHAELFNQKFTEEKEEKWLLLLLATLWREKSEKYNPNDIRKPFSEFDELENRAKKFKRLPYKIKMACLLNYIGMRNAYVNEEIPKFVFDKPSDESTESQNYDVLLMRISESQVFGNYYFVKNTFIHDIIEHLADLKVRHQKSIANQPKV